MKQFKKEWDKLESPFEKIRKRLLKKIQKVNKTNYSDGDIQKE